MSFRLIAILLLVAGGWGLFFSASDSRGAVHPEFPDSGQDNPIGDPTFQSKVGTAISKGIAFLQKGSTVKGHGLCPYGDRLILLTYIHAGVDDSHPHYQELFQKALTDDLQWVYDTSLIAMCLEEVDRVKYQWRIHQCAQFLADNIGPDGQVHYGKPTELPPPPNNRDVESSPKNGRSRLKEGEKPKPTRLIQVTQKRVGEATYDHSNMQYFALGLRACHDAGIRFDLRLIRKFESLLRKNQIRDPKAKKEEIRLDRPSRSSRSSRTTQAAFMVAPSPWDYHGKGGVRGSMVAGAVGALCICDYILRQDWRQDTNVLEGMQWLHKNFTVTENIGDVHNGAWYAYYMYGLERAGMLFGTETIGAHRWYLEGATELLKRQNADGSWPHTATGGSWGEVSRDTCFAILFLKRATHRLDVASGSGK